MNSGPCITCYLFLMFVSALGGLLSGINHMERKAAEHGCAEYHHQTGEWQWKQSTESKG